MHYFSTRNADAIGQPRVRTRDVSQRQLHSPGMRTGVKVFSEDRSAGICALGAIDRAQYICQRQSEIGPCYYGGRIAQLMQGNGRHCSPCLLNSQCDRTGPTKHKRWRIDTKSREEKGLIRPLRSVHSSFRHRQKCLAFSLACTILSFLLKKGCLRRLLPSQMVRASNCNNRADGLHPCGHCLVLARVKSEKQYRDVTAGGQHHNARSDYGDPAPSFVPIHKRLSRFWRAS